MIFTEGGRLRASCHGPAVGLLLEEEETPSEDEDEEEEEEDEEEVLEEDKEPALLSKELAQILRRY